MCHLSALPEEKRDDIGNEVMSLDLFEQLAEDSFPFADRVTIGFAGEPTLHPQIGEFLKIARSFGIEVEVYTNGTTLHKDTVCQAIAQYADWLVVSMDGAEEETFAQIRGGASLRSIETSIGAIRDYARTIERHAPLRIGAHCTIMRSNIAQLKSLVEKAHRLEIDRVSSSHIGIFDGNLQEESLFLYREESDRNIQAALERAAELGVQTDFPPQFGATTNAISDHRYSCFQVNYSLIVLSNGNVLPCCHAAARWRLVMGNLRQSRLPDIWYGYRYELLRRCFMQSDLPPACRDCATNNPFMDVSTEWDLETISSEATCFEEGIEYMHIQHEFAKKLFREQEDLLQSALQEESKLDARFQSISRLESQVDIQYRLFDIFREQRASHIEKFGCLAYPLSANSITRRINRLLYEQGEEFQGNMPLRLEVSLTAGCNIQCIMCTLTHLPKEEQRELLKRRMTRETYRQLANEAFPYAESIFFGIGGEPTLHPDFAEFTRIAFDAGLDVHVSSNGMSFTNDLIAQSCVDYVSHLIISMDGARKETFERIRRGADWDRILAGIQNLVGRREESPHSRLSLSINFTLMKDTIDEFPQMVDLARRLGVNKLMAEHLIATKPELQDQSLFNHRQHSDRRMREALQRAGEIGLEMEIPDLFDMDSVPQDVTPGVIRNIRPKECRKDIPYCHILKYSAVVTPDGMVLPCSNPNAQEKYRMGWLRDSTFSEIWFGSGFQWLREGTNGNTPNLCAQCAMSGRSDGELPTHQSSGILPMNGVGHRVFYPQSFVSRSLHLMERLLEQNNRIRMHIECLRDLDGRMAQHEKNLSELIAVQNELPPLAAQLTWLEHPPRRVSGNAHFSFSVLVRNTGSETWLDGDKESSRSVMIGGAFYQHDLRIAYMEGWGKLPHALAPFHDANVVIFTNVSYLIPGVYQLKIDAVKLGMGFFSEFGSSSLDTEIEITLADESEILWQRALPRCTNLWSLSQGIRLGRDGTYPLFITGSDRARVTDKGGRRYLDYIMGWGTATLGYNHPAVREAVTAHLSIGPTLPLPHPLQVEVADKLCNFLPCGERVLFGKNGSDVLEAAVRIARAHTGKDIVLCCGYHGFHDWYLSSLEGIAGIAQADRGLVRAFPYGDLDELRVLLDSYHNRIAALVIEPASLAYPPDGYLQTIRAWTQERGIVLIFDEIMSAFRLANGGAQELYNVQPDMVAVGKGIANGLPLAALAGRRSIVDCVFRVGYGPTFHGEVYALAAANAALDVYIREPVCQHLNAMGQALRAGIEKYARRYGIALHLSGIAPRQVFEFQPMESYSAAQIRTYFLQELLEAGILCGGTLLPSYAHTKQDIRFTLRIIKKTLRKIKYALHRKTLMEELRIPLHVLYLGEKCKERN